jgi:hypothetical protein
MTKNNLENCRICGLGIYNYYPWGENGKSPSFDICSEAHPHLRSNALNYMAFCNVAFCRYPHKYPQRNV